MEDGTELVSLRELPSPLSPAYRWDLSPETLINAGLGSDPLFYDLRAVRPLDDSLLLIHDPFADSPLLVLDHERRTVVARFGSKGQGPGELGEHLVLLGSVDSILTVLDPNNRQVHRFTLRGQQLSSSPFQPPHQAGGGAPLGEGGAVMVAYPDGVRSLASITEAGEFQRVLGPLPSPTGGSGPRTIQQGQVLWTALGNSSVSMWSASSRVRIDSRDGGTRILELPLSARRLTTSDVAEQQERLGGMGGFLRPGLAAITNYLYPVNDSTFGVFTSSLWHAAEDPDLPAGTIYWRMFSTSGEYVGVTVQPDGFRYLGLGDGTVWGRSLTELGEPQLVEYALVKPN